MDIPPSILVIAIISIIVIITLGMPPIVKWFFKPRKAIAQFVLHDFRADYEMRNHRVESIYTPDEVQGLDNLMLVFSLDCPSPVPLWIRTYYLRVVQVKKFYQATFPYFYDREFNRIDLTQHVIQGYIELKPEQGLLKMKITKVAKMGLDFCRDENIVEIFSQTGYQYRVRLAIEWVDNIYKKDKMKKYDFDEEVCLDFPELLPWQHLLLGSRKIRIIFFNQNLDALIKELELLSLLPYCTILISSPHDTDCPDDNKNALEYFKDKPGQIGFIPHGDGKELEDIVGLHSGRIKNFILSDTRFMILQSEKDLNRGEIIEDHILNNTIKDAFDALAQRIIR